MKAYNDWKNKVVFNPIKDEIIKHSRKNQCKTLNKELDNLFR
jgi:hypothetical protein